MEENNISRQFIDSIKKFFWMCVENKKASAVFFSGVLIILFFLYLHFPPADFPKDTIFTVTTGESLDTITDNLYQTKVIRSKFLFRTSVIALGGEKKVIAGDYLLDKKDGPVDLAFRLVNGNFHLDVKRITIPEGWNVFEIADYLADTLVNFDKNRFVSLAKPKEGYLFPDTYFVSPAIKPNDLIEKMAKTFNEKIPDIPGIATTTYKFKDVIIMASILEKEARTLESRRIIAGILWKRLSLGMPLQVDSTFEYVNGKNTYELSLDDLKIDSPYNTYLHKGLPIGPIGNPGIEAILAAITPTQTKYLYFLSSRDGTMHYAKTFEEHKKNRLLYLN